MRVLGLSAFQRRAAAALVVDGQAVAAACEEGFTHLALDPAFPLRAARWSLARAGIAGLELDAAIFYEKPLRRFERMLVRATETFPRAPRAFARSAFAWLGDRLWIKNRIAAELDLAPARVGFVDQARAHLAAAFHSAPFDSAALLHLDDVGEWTTTALGRGDARGIELLAEVRHPHSLGHLASALTQFLGFAPGEDEHKLEALAARGTPRFQEELARLCPDRQGFFELEQACFQPDEGAERLYTRALEQRLGPARAPGQPLRWQASDTRDADLAASLQAVLEERALALARELHRRTNLAGVCVSGLLASNRALITRLAAEGPFERVWVAPEPGKGGAALGAALLGHHALAPEVPLSVDAALGEALGTEGEPGSCALADATAVQAELAGRLLRGELVGWARGALEFAERSLGGRVALALASAPEARARLLAALQHVEGYLPCRLALPAERAGEFVELPARAAELAGQARVVGRAHAALARAAPGAAAPDGLVWPQLVSAQRDPELHGLLARLAAAGAAPLLFVTDLALRGTPLARTEADALEVFRRGGLDVLVAGTRLYAR